MYSTDPEFRAAIQQRHKESAADPRAPPDIPEPKWYQQRHRWQRQLGHLNRPGDNPNFDRAGMTSVRIAHMETSVEGISAHAVLLVIVGYAERSWSSRQGGREVDAVTKSSAGVEQLPRLAPEAKRQKVSRSPVVRRRERPSTMRHGSKS